MVKQLIADENPLGSIAKSTRTRNIKENRQAESAKDCKLSARQSSMELRRKEI